MRFRASDLRPHGWTLPTSYSVPRVRSSSSEIAHAHGANASAPFDDCHQTSSALTSVAISVATSPRSRRSGSSTLGTLAQGCPRSGLDSSEATNGVRHLFPTLPCSSRWAQARCLLPICRYADASPRSRTSLRLPLRSNDPVIGYNQWPKSAGKVKAE